jgi:hypothetical protein
VTAAGPYVGLRRALGIVVAALLVAALFQLLRVGERVYSLTSSASAPGQLAPEPGMAADPPIGQSTSTAPAVSGGSTAEVGHGGQGTDKPSTASRPIAPSGRQSAVAWAPAVPRVTTATLHAPRPGGYSYRWTVNGESSAGKIVVASAGGSGGQWENETTPAGSAVQVDTVAWSGTGRSVIRTVFPDGTVCQWVRPLASLQLPLVGGSRWKVTSSCLVPSQDGSNASLQVNEDVKVDGTAQLTISGQPTTVWVTERHRLMTEKSAAFSGTIETQSTELFAPSEGLVVYRVARTATPKPDGSTETTTEIAELLDIAPS